ncbi:MAG: hypothetical protein AAGL24_00630 [Pseudomonadota bacterium]
MLPVRVLILLLFLSGAVQASDVWRTSPVDPASMPPDIVAESGRLAPNGLPDGLVGRAAKDGDLAAAWYEGPTKRYGHAILGDAVEAGILKVRSRAGKTYTLVLPETEVFEDRTPRLVDLDGNGTIEVVTIRASVTQGAAVTVYGLAGDTLSEVATTPFIGRANRWLNIAGIADFAGNGRHMIAFVRTPHIGGTLYFYDLASGTLRQRGALYGFSNHQIGAREMRLSAIADVDDDGRPELALPSDNRRSLKIVKLGSTGPKVLADIALPGRIDKAIAVRGRGRATRFTVGLDNGDVIAVHR